MSIAGVGMIPVADVLLESGEDGCAPFLVAALLVGGDLVAASVDDSDLVGALVSDWDFDALLGAGKDAGAPRLQPANNKDIDRDDTSSRRVRIWAARIAALHFSIERRDTHSDSSDRRRRGFTLLFSKLLQRYARRSYIGIKALVRSFA